MGEGLSASPKFGHLKLEFDKSEKLGNLQC